MLTVNVRAVRAPAPIRSSSPSDCDRRAFPRRRAKGSATYLDPTQRLGRPPAVRLLDISQGGAQLLLPQAVEAGDELEVELVAPGRRKFQRRAVVRWVGLAPDRLWRVGCEWEHRLSFSELTNFI